ETVDIGGSGRNRLVAGVAEVLRVAAETKQLLVRGGSDDQVNVLPGAQRGVPQTVDGQTFSVFTQSGARVLVSNVTRVRPDGVLAANDSSTLRAGTTLSRTASTGVLANDVRKPGAHVRLIGGPAFAAGFSLAASGSFVYTPLPSFTGPDRFTYTI